MSTILRNPSSPAAYCSSGREMMQSPTVASVKPSGTLVSNSRARGRFESNFEGSFMPGSTGLRFAGFWEIAVAIRRKGTISRTALVETAIAVDDGSIRSPRERMTDEETSYRIGKNHSVRPVLLKNMVSLIAGSEVCCYKSPIPQNHVRC